MELKAVTKKIEPTFKAHLRKSGRATIITVPIEKKEAFDMDNGDEFLFRIVERCGFQGLNLCSGLSRLNNSLWGFPG